MVVPERLLFPELSYRVNGIYYDVYDELRGGLLESSYRTAMGIALRDAGLQCEEEVPIEARFRGHVIGQYRIDLVVERSIILECKTSDSLSIHYRTQVINYLRVSGLTLGIVLLFGAKPATERVVFETARMPINRK